MWSGLVRHVAALGSALLLVAACGDDASRGDAAAAGSGLEGSITVFAAASLTDAFEELGAAFQDANPGATVRFNFAGSSSLREQIIAGAPADVFASASTSHMDQVVDAREAADPSVFARTRLQIAVPAGNAAGVTGLDDLADSDLLIGLCAEEVPCGELGRQVLANAGVTPDLDTNEPDVRSLLTKIEAGELDAGIVYATDVIAAGEAVDGVDIPGGDNVTVEYPIAALQGSTEREIAAAFVVFVLSAEGQAILSSHGFEQA